MIISKDANEHIRIIKELIVQSGIQPDEVFSKSHVCLSADDIIYQARTPQHDRYISERHMMYGPTLSAMDIDFVLVEKARDNPVCIIDYKRSNCNAKTLADIKRSSTINTLASMAGIPGLTVLYSVDAFATPTYYIFHCNPMAENLLKCFYQTKGLAPRKVRPENWHEGIDSMQEKDYVAFLYYLRGEEMPNLKLFEEKDNNEKKDNDCHYR